MNAGFRPTTSPPSALLIEFTSHCNLKCAMCPLTARRTASGLRPGHVSDRVWTRIVEFARQVDHVVVAGYGEPLANPNCVDYLRQLDELGIPTSLTTNGTLATDRVAGQLASLRLLGAVHVSIDSPDPDVYRQIRAGDLARALEGAGALARALGAKVAVTSVLMKSTLDTLPAFPAILSALGVRRFVLQGLIDYTAGVSEEELRWRSDLPGRVDAVKRAGQAAGVEVSLTLPDGVAAELREPAHRGQPPDHAHDEHDTRQCGAPWDVPVIDKDGRVFPCCYALSNQSSVLGDLREERGEAVWEGERYERFRRQLLDGRTMPDICRGCAVVPWGPHPLARYAAEIVAHESHLSAAPHLTLRARNTGRVAWTPADRVFIGTAAPRDHPSAFHHPSWIGHNRVTSFSEPSVPPGGVATFRFEISPAVSVAAEAFQLVVENQCWIPNTRFQVQGPPPPARGRDWRRWFRL